jgi:tetratricopeptide (TPR) repeat protein
VLSEDEEDAIRSEAEASNQDEDIVTEAMAEVYARQGLIQKAIDIYEKLSLLDPDRTSTFADRISQLKALLT